MFAGAQMRRAAVHASRIHVVCRVRRPAALSYHAPAVHASRIYVVCRVQPITHCIAEAQFRGFNMVSQNLDLRCFFSQRCWLKKTLLG